MLATLAGCGDSPKNTTEQSENDKERARIEQNWASIAAEKEFAQKNAEAEAKRLAFERAKLEIERENFEVEKARIAGGRQPSAPPAAAPPIVRAKNNPPAEPAADIAKAQQENEEKLRAAEAASRNEQFKAKLQSDQIALDRARAELERARLELERANLQDAKNPPDAQFGNTARATPTPQNRTSGKRERGRRPTGIQPSQGLQSSGGLD